MNIRGPLAPALSPAVSVYPRTPQESLPVTKEIELADVSASTFWFVFIVDLYCFLYFLPHR